MAIRLIAGLGNPGPTYARTRHNVGALFVEGLARHADITMQLSERYSGFVGRGEIGGQEVRLLIPTTYMNRSGTAVAALASFYKVDVHEILVAYDEMAFAPGVCRLKQGGGDNGHNGLKDIVRAMGNRSEFVRLRIGVGHPGNKDQVTGYLTGRKIPVDEQRVIDEALERALAAVPEVVAGQLLLAMNRLHSA